jgi:hypothetical protein
MMRRMLNLLAEVLVSALMCIICALSLAVLFVDI